MLLESRPSKPQGGPRKNDKEQIVSMLADVKDQFAGSIYKQPYDIAERGTMAKLTPAGK